MFPTTTRSRLHPADNGIFEGALACAWFCWWKFDSFSPFSKSYNPKSGGADLFREKAELIEELCCWVRQSVLCQQVIVGGSGWFGSGTAFWWPLSTWCTGLGEIIKNGLISRPANRWCIPHYIGVHGILRLSAHKAKSSPQNSDLYGIFRGAVIL